MTGLTGPSSWEGYQKRLYDECATTNWDPGRDNTFAEECAHLHEEVSEAFRWWRLYQDFEVTIDADGRPHGIPIELADVLIGLFYLAELHGFDLLAAVELKHRFNLTRDYVAEGRQLHARPRPPEYDPQCGDGAALKAAVDSLAAYTADGGNALPEDTPND